MELSERILGSFYKPDAIRTKAVQKMGKGKVKVTYVFPPYERTLEDMGHVSMSQMQEGLIEGLYCVIGDAIEHGEMQTTLDIASYIRRMAQALFMAQHLSFRKMLQAGEQAELILEIIDVQEQMRGKFFAVTVSVEGFMRGHVECWLRKHPSEISDDTCV